MSVEHKCPNCGAFPVERPGPTERKLAEAQAEIADWREEIRADAHADHRGHLHREVAKAQAIIYRLCRDCDKLQAALAEAQAALEQAREALSGLANELTAGAHALYRQKALLRTDADWILAKAQKARSAVAALDAGKETAAGGVT